ncbi:helix-turn-helix transcriptional regulator [bacterium]|nr:helix-turn-helix transcriptional regulator [bacterium]
MNNKNKLKELREEQNISLGKLSKILKEKYKLNVSPSQLMYYEKGIRSPRDNETWEIIADYFNVSIAYLMGFSDSPDGNDKPIGFDSVEEYEKARKIRLDKYVNNPNSKQIGIAHGANGKEKLISYKTGFTIDYSMLIDFKYDEEGLSETKLKTLDIYNELNTEYKKMLFINALDLIDESKESDILKIADNIKSTQIADENDRKNWLEEMKLAHSQEED